MEIFLHNCVKYVIKKEKRKTLTHKKASKLSNEWGSYVSTTGQINEGFESNACSQLPDQLIPYSSV